VFSIAARWWLEVGGLGSHLDVRVFQDALEGVPIIAACIDQPASSCWDCDRDRVPPVPSAASLSLDIRSPRFVAGVISRADPA
jgi:hypothetical protein